MLSAAARRRPASSTATHRVADVRARSSAACVAATVVSDRDGRAHVGRRVRRGSPSSAASCAASDRGAESYRLGDGSCSESPARETAGGSHVPARRTSRGSPPEQDAARSRSRRTRRATSRSRSEAILVADRHRRRRAARERRSSSTTRGGGTPSRSVRTTAAACASTTRGKLFEAADVAPGATSIDVSFHAERAVELIADEAAASPGRATRATAPDPDGDFLGGRGRRHGDGARGRRLLTDGRARRRRRRRGDPGRRREPARG